MPITELILTLIPEEALPLLVAILGLALVVGIVSRRRAAGMVIFVISLPVIDLILGALLDRLPTWLLLAVSVLAIGQLLRTVVAAVFRRKVVRRAQFALFTGAFGITWSVCRLALRTMSAIAAGALRSAGWLVVQSSTSRELPK